MAKKPFDYLLAGKNHSAQIVNVDSKGDLISGSNDVEVSFYRIQWRWWWDDNGDNLSNFTQNEYNKLLKKETVHLTNGRAQWTFGTSENEWGALFNFSEGFKERAHFWLYIIH
ncbi:MAG: hypothetical protein WDM90_01775 [Ferruginibacter sp.]